MPKSDIRSEPQTSESSADPDGEQPAHTGNTDGSAPEAVAQSVPTSAHSGSDEPRTSNAGASATRSKGRSKGRTASRLPLSLSERAHTEGERWANEFRSQIHGEQRRAAGGWPGTMSEARARLAGFVLPRVSSKNAVTFSQEDREEAARCLYRSARASWAQHQEREEDLGT